jgi:hypothetical protein
MNGTTQRKDSGRRHPRRHFLRGVGGAVVAAPFLSSVAERAARAEGLAVDTPARLIVMWQHYGCLTDRWFPMSAHGPLTSADYTGLTIEALAPYAEKLLMPRGIRAMNEWTANLERGQGNDPHTQVSGTWLTCVPVTPNSDDPFSFDASTKANAMPIAASLDHVMAKQVSPTGVPMFMRVSGRADSNTSAISYSGPEEAYPGIGSLSQAYNSLTGLFDGGAGAEMSPDTYQAMRGKAVLDLVRLDLEDLERFDMSGSDRTKLEAWKDLLIDTGNVVSSAQCNEELAATLGIVSEGGMGGNEGGLGSDVSEKVAGDLDTADLFSNMAVLVAACNANPVIFLKFPGNYVFSGLGLSMESHSISHRVGDAGMGGTCVEDVNNMLETMDRWYAEKFAYLVGQLDSIADGSGTLLDSSIAVWFNEDSDGNAHNLNNLPILQAGSGGGRFKTGQAVNVEDGDPNLSRGNSVGPCDGGGEISFAQVTSTGSPPEVGNAPINKYFCNLMNALGVKAGEDGFPAEGGTQEVTHFGMYDRTEDFIGGGDKPANITDPGQFTDLLANG